MWFARSGSPRARNRRCLDVLQGVQGEPAFGPPTRPLPQSGSGSLACRPPHRLHRFRLAYRAFPGGRIAARVDLEPDRRARHPFLNSSRHLGPSRASPVWRELAPAGCPADAHRRRCRDISCRDLHLRPPSRACARPCSIERLRQPAGVASCRNPRRASRREPRDRPKPIRSVVSSTPPGCPGEIGWRCRSSWRLPSGSDGSSERARDRAAPVAR